MVPLVKQWIKTQNLCNYWKRICGTAKHHNVGMRKEASSNGIELSRRNDSVWGRRPPEPEENQDLHVESWQSHAWGCWDDHIHQLSYRVSSLLPVQSWPGVWIEDQHTRWPQMKTKHRNWSSVMDPSLKRPHSLLTKPASWRRHQRHASPAGSTGTGS